MRAAPAPRPPRTPTAQPRAVSFPDEPHLLASYLDPNDPWAHVEETTGEELSIAYEESCKKHSTVPLECVVHQLKEMRIVNGSSRQGTLMLTGCILTPTACETLEAILKKVRFQRIDVHDCQLNDDAAVALFDMVEYYESASELDISGNKNLGIQGWQACSKMVNKSQWLEQLELRDTSLSESYAPVLGRGLRPACSLRSLHLQRSHLSGAPLLCLAGYLKQNKSVRELHIGDNQLVASDAKHLASMLKSNSSLQLLDISNNDIQDSGIEAIADALEEQSSVQSSSSSSSSDSPMSSPQSSSSGSVQDRGLAVLIVWNNNLTRNSGKSFSKALARCRSLEVLNIGQNPLCGETVNRFRNALQQNRTLLSLGMQSTKLCAEAAIALAEVIEDNPVIQRIDLRDNKLQTAGLLALATALKKNLTVTRIDLDDAPPSQLDKDQPLEETRLVTEIRSLCKRNESRLNPSNLLTDDDDSTSLQRRRAASFTTRKISLTCQTLHPHPEPVLSPPKTSTGRLRSPSPSPIPSPASSPIPSPSHRSRFQVSRVSDSSSVSSQSPSPSTPPGSRSFFPGNSRFRVVSVQEPPSISVQSPDETIINSSKPNVDTSDNTKSEKFVKYQNSRFLIKRNVELNEREIIKQASTNIVSPIPSKNNESPLDNSEKITDSNTKDLEINTYDNKFPNKDEVLPIEENGQKKTFNVIKKNKSESSLDSPDLEVSRLMQNQGKKSNYDSSSSLDISGSSMESLNTLEMSIDSKIQTENIPLKQPVKQALSVEFSLDSEENDVFSEVKVPQKLSNLSSSNESSLDLSAPVEVPQGNIFHFSNQSFLNSSVSSNESVSPNIFGKHMKLHGSVTSLEASVSSLDSFKSSCNTLISPGLVDTTPQNFSTTNKNNLVDSTDSGIFQSDNSPRTANDSMSSNEGTLTDNSSLTKMMKSIGSSLELQGKIPERTASLLDVPSSSSKQRVRKISWVSPTPQRKDNEEASQSKGPSNLEKLLNIFQIPGNLFSRNTFDTSEKKADVQSVQRRDSQSSNVSGSFWPWSLGSTSASSSKSQTVKCEGDKNISRVTSSVSAEYTVKLDKKPVQDDSLTTHATVTKVQADSFIDNDVMAASASSGTVGLFQLKSTVGDGVSSSGMEHGVLCCDNVDEIEAEDPEIIYSDICDSVSTSTEGLQSELDRDDTDADIANCDSIMVQSTIDANINVTTLSFVEDDNINAKDSVQNNLLVLSACDINLGPDGSQPICDLNSETGDCLFTKSSKIIDAPLKSEDNIQVIDLETETCEILTVSNISKYSNEEITNDNNATISVEENIFTPGSLILDNIILTKQTNTISDVIDSHASDSDLLMDDTSKIPLDNKIIDLQKEILQENFDPIKTTAMSELIEEHLKECSDFTLRSKDNKDTLVIDDVLECPKIEIDTKLQDDNPIDKVPSSVLKQSIGLENKTSPSDKQLSPESGPSIDNLPSKIIKRIKENISPENTLTSSMSNTQALVQELAERRNIEPIDFNKEKFNISSEDVKNMENQCLIDDENVDKLLNMIKVENENRQETAVESYFTSENLKNENLLNQHFMATLVITEKFEETPFEQSPKISCDDIENAKSIMKENTQLDFNIESKNIDVSVEHAIEEAKDVLKEIDMSEQNIDESKSDDVTEVSALNQNSCITNVDDKSVASKHNIIKPVSILKRSYNERKHCSLPRNIPEQNKKDNEKHTPIRCGSLPESISSYSPKSDLTSRSKIGKSRSPINTLGKMARDSLYALNMSDDDITELAHSKRLSSLESVRSLGSVSEDAGDMFPLRKVLSSSESRSLGPCASQESLASLASISEMVAEGGAPTTEAPKNDDRV